MTDKSTSEPRKNKNILIYLLLFVAAVSAFSGAIIMTDVGQIFGIDKSWVVWYFSNSTVIVLVSVISFLAAIFLIQKEKMFTTKTIVILSVIWVGGLLVSKYMTPYLMFRAQQYDAKYISI